MRYFEGKYNENEIKKLLKSRTLSPKDIKEYFSKIEVYKTIIMDGNLSLRFDIPEPNTLIPDFKSMYVCQKIFQKIEKAYFSAQQQFTSFSPDPEEFQKIDLEEEMNYIKRELFGGEDFENEFRISKRTVPKYLKVEVWKNYIFCDEEYKIDPKDIFQNNNKLADEILMKVIKGVLGSTHPPMQDTRRFRKS